LNKILRYASITIVLLVGSTCQSAPSLDRRGRVDMASLGGKFDGTSRLREASSGFSGVDDPTPMFRRSLRDIRDCHEAAIRRGLPVIRPSQSRGFDVKIGIAADGTATKLDSLLVHRGCDVEGLAAVCHGSTYQCECAPRERAEPDPFHRGVLLLRDGRDAHLTASSACLGSCTRCPAAG
jgi:hypothetical protein